MKLRWLFAVILLAGVGCKDKAQNAPAGTRVPPSTPTPAKAVTEEDSLKPDTLLAEVNGQKLTYADVAEQLRTRMDAAASRMPPERLPALRKQLLSGIVEQHVLRTLLLEETDRRKIEVSKEDEDKAYAKIRESLPSGMTLEDVMKTSPLGEKKMREEVTVGIRIDKLLAQCQSNEVAVTDEEVSTFMAENKERLSLPERATAKHILIAVNPTDDEAAKAAKKEKAEKIQKELAAGADFAKAARENSDCPSKQKGGDLGTFARGQMVKPFEDAAYGQEIGAIGPVVETQFGYHIIQVTDRKEAGMAGQKEVIEVLKAQKRQKTLRAFVDDLKAKAKVVYGPGYEPLPQGR